MGSVERARAVDADRSTTPVFPGWNTLIDLKQVNLACMVEAWPDLPEPLCRSPSRLVVSLLAPVLEQAGGLDLPGLPLPRPMDDVLGGDSSEVILHFLESIFVLGVLGQAQFRDDRMPRWAGIVRVGNDRQPKLLKYLHRQAHNVVVFRLFSPRGHVRHKVRWAGFIREVDRNASVVLTVWAESGGQDTDLTTLAAVALVNTAEDEPPRARWALSLTHGGGIRELGDSYAAGSAGRVAPLVARPENIPPCRVAAVVI